MGFWDVTGPDGRTYPKVEAESMEAAIAKVRGQQEPRAAAAQTPASAPEMGFAESMRLGAGPGALADTAFGSLSREGARSTAGVILDPQTPAEQAASAMVQALPVARAGTMAAKAATGLPAIARAVAPAAARAITTGVEGAASKAFQGGDLGDVSYQAAFDTLVAGALESVAGTTAKMTGASAAVKAAMDAAKSSLPNGKFIFPTIAGTTKITLDEAAEKLASMGGAAYKIGREEVGWVLDALDRAARTVKANPALSPVTAGRQFLARTPDKPGRFQAIADWLSGNTGNNVRAGADVAGTQEVAPGIPLAVPAAAATTSIPSAFGGVAGRLMGVMR